ncbi:MAG: NYN domain-containing protein [Lysobacteraceae bacterium]|nr:MAG: NYN domain-containing protein [Xanthomonadaceae bacterium]
MDDRMRIALLIDADNAPASKIEVVLAELARHGIANVRRAYGNWKSPTLQKWEAALHPNAIQPIQQFALSTGKNASDMAMVVDAMDLLHSGRFDAFAIVSSDADFTPLAMRLRAQNMRVFGFGEKKTPEPFVNACSTFLYIDEHPDGAKHAGGPADTSAPVPPVPTAKLRQDTKLVNLLRDAVEAEKEDDGWASLSAVGTNIRNRGPFDARNYGYGKLSSLIEATGLFETRRDEGNHPYARAKPKSAKQKG